MPESAYMSFTSWNGVFPLEMEVTVHVFTTFELYRLTKQYIDYQHHLSMFFFLFRYFKLCSSQRYSLSARQSRNTSLVLMCLNLVLAAPCLLLFQNNHRGVCQIGQVTLRSVLVKAYYRSEPLLAG